MAQIDCSEVNFGKMVFSQSSIFKLDAVLTAVREWDRDKSYASNTPQRTEFCRNFSFCLSIGLSCKHEVSWLFYPAIVRPN